MYVVKPNSSPTLNGEIGAVAEQQKEKKGKLDFFGSDSIFQCYNTWKLLTHKKLY
jgi:hypothetical protein